MLLQIGGHGSSRSCSRTWCPPRCCLVGSAFGDSLCSRASIRSRGGWSDMICTAPAACCGWPTSLQPCRTTFGVIFSSRQTMRKKSSDVPRETWRRGSQALSADPGGCTATTSAPLISMPASRCPTGRLNHGRRARSPIPAPATGLHSQYWSWARVCPGAGRGQSNHSDE